MVQNFKLIKRNSLHEFPKEAVQCSVLLRSHFIAYAEKINPVLGIANLNIKSTQYKKLVPNACGSYIRFWNLANHMKKQKASKY